MAPIILTATFLNILLGIIVLLNARNKVQKHFAILIFIIALWALSNAVYLTFPRYPFVNISYAAGGVLIGSVFFWIAEFTNTSLRKLTKIVIVTIVALLFVLSLIPNVFLGSEHLVFPYGLEVEIGPLFNVYSVLAIAILLSGVWLLFRSMNQSKGLERLRLLYVMFGFVIPIIIVIVLDFILPLFGVLWIASYDSLTSFLFAGFISYAITRYRFFDIHIAIRKGVVQFLTFGFMFGLYAYLLLFLERSLSDSTNADSRATLLIIIVVIVLTVEPLRKFIYRFIDTVVSNREKTTREALERIRLLSNSTTQFSSLVERVTGELSHVFDAEVSFLLKYPEARVFRSFPESMGEISMHDPAVTYLAMGRILITDELPLRIENGEKELDDIYRSLTDKRIDLLLPVGSGEDMIGILLFRKKNPASVFTQESVQFLKRLREQITFAFCNALAYKQALERMMDPKFQVPNSK